MIQSQSFQIEIGTYRRWILVCVNETNDEVERLLTESGFTESEIKKAASAEPDSVSAAMTYVFGNRNCLVRFKVEEPTPDFHDCVAHEAFHCAAGILDYVGVKLGSKSEEAYAYLLGYIVKEIYEKLTTTDQKQVTWIRP